MGATNTNPSSEQTRRRLAAHTLFPVLLIAATIAVYFNSFDGVLVLDDQRYIADNPRVHQLWPVWPLLARRRPIVDISLAANYALGGLDLRGYHAVNLGVHMLAALTLYGIIRRTLLLDQFKEQLGRVASHTAFAIALLWAVHPLQTQSVTYLIQRAESMMGLFYLLTIYGVLRSAASTRGWAWCLASVIACALGMGSKAVMITAPVLVLLFDRVFLAPSFRQVVRRRWGLYVGLFGSWSVLFASGLIRGVLATSRPNATAGFSYKGISPLEYAVTQPGVILHYLRLAVCPRSLCLDYDWPPAASLMRIVPPAIVVAILLGVTVWALFRRPWLGFLGAWFFVILSPTSSFVPLRDPLFEHRMYLPLAAVIALGVCGVRWALGELTARWQRKAERRRVIAGLALAAVAAAFAWGTIDRNRDYHSAVAMWKDVAAKRPDSDRAHYNLGAVLLRAQKWEEAETAFQDALALNPRSDRALYNLGKIRASRRNTDEALAYYRQALHVNPRLAEAHNDVANILVRRGQTELAVRHYRDAVTANPRYVQARFNLGNVLLALGEFDAAVAELSKAAELAPRTSSVHFALGRAYEARRDLEDAVSAYRHVLLINPDHAGAAQALAALRSGAGTP
ncbi:MAG: tetratricopeptide repeat protein [Phycisphaerae bacterium]|jgi:tetratricopeptide (TPR) repeat protein